MLVFPRQRLDYDYSLLTPADHRGLCLQAAEAVAARAVQAGAASLTALLPAELAAQLPAELRRCAGADAYAACLPASAPGACARLC